MCFFFTSPGNSIFTLSIDGRSTRPSVGPELSHVASQIPWAIPQFLRISKAWIKQKEQSRIRQEPNMCAGISVSKGCLTIIPLIDYRFVHFSYCFSGINDVQLQISWACMQQPVMSRMWHHQIMLTTGMRTLDQVFFELQIARWRLCKTDCWRTTDDN